MKSITKKADSTAPTKTNTNTLDPSPVLNAKNLKTALWETLLALKTDQIEPHRADAIAAQAREILRTANTQLRIAQQSKRQVGVDLINFSED